MAERKKLMKGVIPSGTRSKVAKRASSVAKKVPANASHEVAVVQSTPLALNERRTRDNQIVTPLGKMPNPGPTWRHSVVMEMADLAPNGKVEKKVPTSKVAELFESEEIRALKEQGEKMKNDPAYAMEVARKAGIVTSSGKLASYYSKKA